MACLDGAVVESAEVREMSPSTTRNWEVDRVMVARVKLTPHCTWLGCRFRSLEAKAFLASER